MLAPAGLWDWLKAENRYLGNRRRGVRAPAERRQKGAVYLPAYSEAPQEDRPHGFVGLDVTADRLTLTVRCQHRHWWFWRRWRTHELALAPWRIKANDTVQLRQAGETYVATVNGEVVLRWPPEPEVGRYKGFGMRAGGEC